MNQDHGKLLDLLSLLTFAVFALCVLGVLLTGAGVYQRLVEGSEERYEERTLPQYVTARVRQAEQVAVADFEGCATLVLGEEAGGETYITRVYLYDGMVRELYSIAGAKLSPEDGEKVLPANRLEFSLEDGLLTVKTDHQEWYLHIPDHQEGMP